MRVVAPAGNVRGVSDTTGAGQPKWQRGFWALIVTQFQGAFSDNALKTLVTFIALAAATSSKQRNAVVPLLGLLFSLPFILFSMAGGYLADRFSKRSVTLGVKVFEILLMLFALAGLWSKNVPLAMAAVCGMGVHSAFFGPSKYGLLPELLPEKRLSWGTGILELGTFTAIITGIAVGGLLYTAFIGRQQFSALVFLALASCGGGGSGGPGCWDGGKGGVYDCTQVLCSRGVAGGALQAGGGGGGGFGGRAGWQ